MQKIIRIIDNIETLNAFLYQNMGISIAWTKENWHSQSGSKTQYPHIYSLYNLYRSKGGSTGSVDAGAVKISRTDIDAFNNGHVFTWKDGFGGVTFGVNITANLSAQAGLASEDQGIGGSYIHAGKVVLGLKDNDFYAAGKNVSTDWQSEVWSNYSLGTGFYSYGREEMKLGSRESPVALRKEKHSALMGFGYLEQTDIPGDKFGTQEMGLQINFFAGVGLVFYFGIQIPLYHQSSPALHY